MCRFKLPNIIVFDNGTQFSIVTINDFFYELGVQTNFAYVVHPQGNRQIEYANKVILKGIKKKLDGAKGLWVELLHEILWSYHTKPHKTTKDIHFNMVYEA